MPAAAARPLHEIAADIREHWPHPYFGALFLVNAATWSGEHARRVKAELNAMLQEAGR